jgi:hypothetical protein
LRRRLELGRAVLMERSHLIGLLGVAIGAKAGDDVGALLLIGGRLLLGRHLAPDGRRDRLIHSWIRRRAARAVIDNVSCSGGIATRPGLGFGVLYGFGVSHLVVLSNKKGMLVCLPFERMATLRDQVSAAIDALKSRFRKKKIEKNQTKSSDCTDHAA